MGLIKSETANKVSQKMAEASSMRPEVVGQTLNQIAQSDPGILQAVMEVMEVEKLLKSDAEVDILPEGASYLVQMSDSKA